MEEDKSEGASESGFAQLLKNRLKKGLVPTQTKVTQQDGSVKLFESKGLTQIQSEISLNMTYGFVVDTKPDLTVGEVRPWLLVSSQDVASDVGIVKDLGITHILSLLPGFELISGVKSQILNHLIVDFYDEESFELANSTGLTSALDFIQSAKDEGGKVLVHCNAGISRAPTVAILYLMKYELFSSEEALAAVKSVRPGVKPNQGFLRQIKEFKSVGLM